MYTFKKQSFSGGIYSINRVSDEFNSGQLTLQGWIRDPAGKLADVYFGVIGTRLTKASKSLSTSQQYIFEATITLESHYKEHLNLALCFYNTEKQALLWKLPPINTGTLSIGSIDGWSTSYQPIITSTPILPTEQILSDSLPKLADRRSQPICQTTSSKPIRNSIPDLLLSSPKQNATSSLRIVLVTKNIIGTNAQHQDSKINFEYCQDLVRAGHAVTLLYAGKIKTIHNVEKWKAYYQRYNITLVLLNPQDSPPMMAPPSLNVSYSVYQHLKNEPFDWILFDVTDSAGYFSTLAKRQKIEFKDATICSILDSSLICALPDKKSIAADTKRLTEQFIQQQSIENSDVILCSDTSLYRRLQSMQWRLPPGLQSFSEEDSPDTTPAADSPEQSLAHPQIIFLGMLEDQESLNLFCKSLLELQNTTTRTFSVTFLGSQNMIGDTLISAFTKTYEDIFNFPFKVVSCKNPNEVHSYLLNNFTIVVALSSSDQIVRTLRSLSILRLPVLINEEVNLNNSLKDDFKTLAFCPATTNGVTSTLQTLLQTWGCRSTPSTAIRGLADCLTLHTTNYTAAHSTTSATKPHVTICIPHYNRPQLLQQALHSVKAQCYSNLSVIIIDTGSDDKAAIDYLSDLTESWCSDSQVLIRTKRRLYPDEARNIAAAIARGEFLIFLDDDNVLVPDAVTQLIRAQQVNDTDILATARFLFSGEDAPNDCTPRRLHFFTAGPLNTAWYRNSLGDTFALIKRETFLNLGGFTQFPRCSHEDYELYIRALLQGYRVDIFPEPLVWYRWHPNTYNDSTSSYRNFQRSLHPLLIDTPEFLNDFLLLGHGTSSQITDKTGIRVEQHQSLLGNRFEKLGTSLLTQDAQQGFADIETCEDTKTFPQPNGMQVIAQNCRHRLSVNGLGSSPGTLSLRIQFSCLLSSQTRVFWRDIHEEYSPQRSISVENSKGDNSLFCELPENTNSYELSIQLGDYPGCYELHSLEVRRIADGTA